MSTVNFSALKTPVRLPLSHACTKSASTCGLLEASCDASELLEPGEAALDEMALGVEVRVERVFLGARGIVGNDGECALVGDAWRMRSLS